MGTIFWFGKLAGNSSDIPGNLTTLPVIPLKFLDSIWKYFQWWRHWMNNEEYLWCKLEIVHITIYDLREVTESTEEHEILLNSRYVLYPEPPTNEILQLFSEFYRTLTQEIWGAGRTFPGLGNHFPLRWDCWSVVLDHRLQVRFLQIKNSSGMRDHCEKLPVCQTHAIDRDSVA